MSPTSVAESLREINWRPFVVLAGALLLIADLTLVTRELIYLHGAAFWEANDWNELVQASTAANPYEADGFRWSPVAAWLLSVLLPMGIWAWRALHVTALLYLRDWRLIALTLISAPFWVDLSSGNAVTFGMVAGVCALRGSRVGALIYLALAVMMPRPLFLPVAVYLLWTQPWLRWPAAGIIVAHVGLSLASGYGGDWAVRLVASSGELSHYRNFAPSALIGAAWVPVGLALSAFLTWKGWLGAASLAAQPYWFATYWLFLVIDADQLIGPSGPERRSRARRARAATGRGDR